MTDDDMLLHVIEAWPTLSLARKKMMLALIFGQAQSKWASQ
jgi:hypothetical protein